MLAMWEVSLGTHSDVNDVFVVFSTFFWWWRTYTKKIKFVVLIGCILQNLLQVHDAVAQKDFEPTLVPVPDDALDEEEDSVKIVSLVKTKEPLVSSYVLKSYPFFF